jgi:uncharacterized membrane protein
MPGLDDRAARRVQWVAFGGAAAAMIATPLLPKGGRARAHLANTVVGGLAGTALAAALRRWGPARTAAAFGTVTAATLAVERFGTSTGLPFGRYGYTDRLPPRVAGVPVAVPLAWFAMALPSRAVAERLLGERSPAAARVAAGSALLTAWDLFLDPQMTAEGYWRWERPGKYRGVPLGNYAGWLVTSAAVQGLLETLLPACAPRTGTSDLAAVYAWMAVMSTVGFAVFFGDPLVALVGGAAMVPPALAAFWPDRRG